mmetsp:Transcript_13852/g.40133  ORF Transcript_13852/g.40133 Transcript_13852/m.40133 type:complete len:214 (+) Transcript_13852:1311-1952(+)
MVLRPCVALLGRHRFFKQRQDVRSFLPRVVHVGGRRHVRHQQRHPLLCRRRLAVGVNAAGAAAFVAAGPRLRLLLLRRLRRATAGRRAAAQAFARAAALRCWRPRGRRGCSGAQDRLPGRVGRPGGVAILASAAAWRAAAAVFRVVLVAALQVRRAGGPRTRSCRRHASARRRCCWCCCCAAAVPPRQLIAEQKRARAMRGGSARFPVARAAR